MNKYLFFLLFLIFFIHQPLIAESSLPEPMLDEIKEKTLRPYINALKNGNVQMLKRYFSDEMYAEYRVLLEENKGYPNTLRKHYADAVFSIDRGEISGNYVIVDFSIEYHDGRKQIVQYELQQQPSRQGLSNTDARQWKINRQRSKRNRGE